MRKSLTSSTALLLAALALPALGVPAFAQGSPAGAAADNGEGAKAKPNVAAPATPMATPSTADTTTAKPPAKHHATRQHRTPLTAEQRAQRVEAHITNLHKELGITAEQQPKWDAFAQVMRDNAANMTKTFDARGSHLASMSAADNMQSYAEVAVQHGQDLQHLATAFQDLYGTMSDSQKKTADTLFRAGPAGRPHHARATQKHSKP